MSAAGNYVINANATTAGDGNTGNDDMLPVTKTKATLAAGTAASNSSAFCITPGTPTLTLTGSAGGDIQWQQSTNNFTTSTNVGTNSPIYTSGSTINQTMYYRAVVTCGTSVTSNIVTVGYNNPIITSNPNQTRCGPGKVTLTSSGNAGVTAMNWYSAATGGSPITFATQSFNSTTRTSSADTVLTANTTFYTSAVGGGVTGLAIPGDGDWQHFTATGAFQTSANVGMTIVVSQTLTLSSVDIYPSATLGTAFSIVARANTSTGTILQTYNGNTTVQNTGTPTVAQTVPINFTLAPGTYHISFPTNPNTWRSGAVTHSYPWVLPGYISLNYDLTPSYQYYFYNLRLSTGCESNRLPVLVTVQTPPALALDASSVTICNGGSGATVSVTAATKPNYTSYKWTPTTGATPGSSPNGSTVLLNPTTNTTYTLTASGGGPTGQCIATAKVSAAVVPVPAAPVISPVNLCTGVASVAMNITNAVGSVITSTGNIAPIAITNLVATDEGSTFTNGITLGTITLPALPVGAIITKAGFIINGVTPVAANAYGSYVRLGLKTTGGANLTTTGYQGSTSVTTAAFNYQTTVANEPTIAAVLPLSGGTFNVVYYSSINNDATKQDVNFPASGTFYYEYTVPVVYNWYTSQFGNTIIATGSTFNPVGVAGSGIANTTTVASATYWVSARVASLCYTNRTAVTYAVRPRPNVTFTTAPTAATCLNTNVTYTTQAGMTSYVWSVPYTLGTDYTISSGGVGTSSNTVTLQWITAGNKTITVNYNNTSGCAATTAASNTTLATASGTASVVIAGNVTTCYGGTVTYTATPTGGGSAPSYQWKKDGTNVGSNSVTYVDPGTTGGVITCVMTSNSPCLSGSPTATSNAITLAVTPNAWTGAVSNNFSVAGNWCAGVVPVGAANISIPGSATNMPKLFTNVTFNDLTIAGGGTFDINGYQLRVNGTLSGAGYIRGSSSSTLILAKSSGSAGTVLMDPTANNLKVMLMTGSSTATLGNALNIIDSVDVDAGTLTTGGFLTLKSTQSGTARVGEIFGGGSVIGNVTVERWLKNVSRRTWRLLSVPTQGAQTKKQAWMENQAPLANGNPGYGTILTSTTGVGQGYDATTVDNSLLVWNPATAAFDYAGATNTPIATTAGYYVYIRGDRSVTPAGSVTTTTTLRTNGGLYLGNQTAFNVAASQNTVVGNVYASAIDFLELTKSGSITAFTIWDPSRAGSDVLTSTGAYVTFSQANGWQPSPTGGSYGTAANTRIESGQAFIVSSASPATITFTEEAKTTGSRQLLRGANTLQRFKTNLYVVAKGVEPAKADGNVVVFDNNYASGLDNYDVMKMNNSGENISILNSGKSLAIDARKKVVSNDVIQLLINNLTSKEYNFEFETENMDPQLTATLEDNYLKTSTPVVLNSTQVVSFKVTAEAGSYAADRFRIVFKSAGTLPVTFTTVRANANGLNNTVLVDWTVGGEKDIKQYEVEYASDSKNFITKGTVLSMGNGVSNTTYNWIHETPSQGMNYYRIKSVSLSGAIKYSSVVRATLGHMSSGFTVAPNPVRDGNVTVQFENKPEGRYNIRLINSSGQVVLTQIANHEGGNSSYRLRIGSTLGSGLYKVEILSPEKTRYVHNLVISNGK